MFAVFCSPIHHRMLRGVVRGPSGKPQGCILWAVPVLLAFVAGCNPVSTGAKLGVRLVGDVVQDADVKQRGESLVGRPVSAADETFGQTIDVFKDVQSDRHWRAYPVKLDVLGRQRYVVEVASNKVVSVSKSDRSSRKVDIPRVLILKDKVKGKSPRECEAKLEFGRPLLTVRSEKTRRLVQLYDAGMVTDLGTPHYCIVRFDDNDCCNDLEFVAVGSSTKKDPVAR